MKQSALAQDIYLPMVDSLYRERRTFLIGTAIVTIAVALTYHRTGEPLLLGNAIAFVGVALVRLHFMRLYHRRKAQIVSNAMARKWEYGYSIGAAISVGLLGLWCYLAFALTADAFSHLVSFSLTIFYMLGIFGRNFGNPKFVLVQIAVAAGPILLSLLTQGNLHHWLFAALLAPFFLAIKFISDGLRQTLLDAILAKHAVSALAQRFDTALSNMPHGLFMLDRTGRIVVSNARTLEILSLDRKLDITGWTIHTFVRYCLKRKIITADIAKRTINHFDIQKGDKVNELIVDLQSSKAIAINFQHLGETGAIALVQDISERRHAEQTISRLANFDSLTSLPNRHQFYDKLRSDFSANRAMYKCALHFIDLDHFKRVNDTLGHSCGDLLLKSVARRIRDVIRPSDIAARFGGDEFVVLQAGVTQADQARALAERLIKEVSRPYIIEGHEVVIGASVGIARPPDDGDDVDKLMRNADMALYEAKATGRGVARFFQSEMDARAQKRRTVELNLRSAIENHQFEVHYQPIVDLATDRIRGCEALLRWRHPERGLISAGVFIEVAEQTGVIVDLGAFILETACRDCLRWPSDVNVAVNISPVQLERTDIVELIKETLRKTGLPAHRLEIEITETALLSNTQDAHGLLDRVREMGVRVSLDDFGTGYSSLSHLHNLPLDKVKIDRSFVSGLGKRRQSLILLKGVSRISMDLGLRVTVEGVETPEQLHLVMQEKSVHEVQGFLFSQATSADEIGTLLRAEMETGIGFVARTDRPVEAATSIRDCEALPV